MAMYVKALENVKEANDSLDNLKVESQDIVDDLNGRLQVEQRKEEDIRRAFRTFRREIMGWRGTPTTVTTKVTKTTATTINTATVSISVRCS